MPANSRALLSSRARRSKNKCMCECPRAPRGEASWGVSTAEKVCKVRMPASPKKRSVLGREHGGKSVQSANACEPQAAEPRRGLGAAEYVVSDANALESGTAVLDLK